MICKRFLCNKFINNKNVFFSKHLQYSTALTNKTQIIINCCSLNQIHKRNMSKKTAIAEFLEAFFKRFPKSKPPGDLEDNAKIITKLARRIPPPPRELKNAFSNSTENSRKFVIDGIPKNTTFWQSPVIRWITNPELAGGVAVLTFGFTYGGAAISSFKPKHTISEILDDKEAGLDELRIAFDKIVKFSLKDHSSKHYNPKYVKLEYKRLMDDYLSKVNKYQDSYLFGEFHNFFGSDIVSDRKNLFYQFLSDNMESLEKLNLPDDDKQKFIAILNQKKSLLEFPPISETIMNSKPESCISKTPLFFIEG
jgi:hypothetical protein